MKYKLYSLIIFVLISLNFSLIETKVEEKATSNMFPITVCIDPGHGGKDGGAICGAYMEKDINLEISFKIKTELEKKGYDVIMTREGDYHLPKGGLYSKAGDLNERIKIINESKAFLLLSIHCNKFSSDIVHGAQTFYKVSSKESMVLASLIQKNIVNNFSDNKRVSKSIENIYLLDLVSIPSVIIECGFMSNSSDLNNLLDTNYQKKFASVIAQSVYEYLFFY